MCRSVNSLLALVFLLAGLSNSIVLGDDDISLSELPQAVRATIERQTKGFEIEDIEQDKDDGKIVYEVDAENDDREIKLKVARDGTLLEKEEELDDDDLPAAILSSIKKSVGNINIDDVERKYQNSSNTYYKIEGETDDFEVDLEIAEDGTILDKDVEQKDYDDDLPDDFRKMRRTFIKLRGQLKVVVIGDSRAEKGVDPKYFLGEENQKYPMAFSFGGDVKGASLAQILCEDYFVHGPKMEWIIYGVSTRIFNRYYRSGDDVDEIRRSIVYREDKTRWAKLPNVRSVPVAVSEMDDYDSPWGFDGEDGVDDDLSDEDKREDAIDDLSEGRYEFDARRLKAFESMIQALGGHNIRLLAFSPPMLPWTLIVYSLPCSLSRPARPQQSLLP